MKMSGARMVLESLKREGVDVVFGLPGGAVLPLYDALYDFPGPLRHVLVRQEAAAGHAAEGYARMTGKVGVCMVTSGPAATNLVTALQDAYMDSMPIVAFTGQVPTHLIGNDAFQEADNVGITRPCTKHNYLVKDIKDIAPRHPRGVPHRGDRPSGAGAHRPAEGRPHEAGRIRLPRERPSPVVQPDVRGAPRPGQEGGEDHHARRAARSSTWAAGSSGPTPRRSSWRSPSMTRIPVTTTLMGLGAFPSDHALSLGMLGMHGGYAPNMAVYNPTA